MLTVEEASERLGVDTLQVFVRAKRMYPWWEGEPVYDHGRWKVWGKAFVPLYARRYLEYVSLLKVPIDNRRVS